MDTLYIGDIPQEYHYAIFNNGYIDLYNSNVLHNGTYTRYRIYTNVDGFFYSVDNVSVGQYTTTYTTSINVSDKIPYRQDYFNIVSLTLIFSLIAIWFLNIITSLVRKGGVLGGLF